MPLKRHLTLHFKEFENRALSLILKSEKQTKWRLKAGWNERVEIVIGGNNKTIMESLCYGTKAILIRVEGEGIFEPRLPLPFLLSN
jgi:hypothetical protein